MGGVLNCRDQCNMPTGIYSGLTQEHLKTTSEIHIEIRPTQNHQKKDNLFTC